MEKKIDCNSNGFRKNAVFIYHCCHDHKKVLRIISIRFKVAYVVFSRKHFNDNDFDEVKAEFVSFDFVRKH